MNNKTNQVELCMVQGFILFESNKKNANILKCAKTTTVTCNTSRISLVKQLSALKNKPQVVAY